MLVGVLSAQQALAQRPSTTRPVAGSSARAAVRAWRESNEARIVREFADLLAIPNIASDSLNIRRNAAALLTMLARRGITGRLLEGDGGPPAVYGELRSPGATRTLVLYAHYDGQPVDPRQWVGGEPFTPTLRDRSLTQGGRSIAMPAEGARVDPESRIYARSAGDDKATIIAILSALDALKASRITPSVNLKFFFEGEEEAGSSHLRSLLERHATLLAADGWIFGDGPVHQSGRMQVVFGVRGVMGVELTVYGPNRALHSGHYGNWAPNPAVALSHLLASMRDEDARITIAGYYDDIRPVSTAERAAIAALPLVDDALRKELALAHTEANDALLGERIMQPALNIRGIRVGNVGDLAANAIPVEAHASIDFRLVPDQSPPRVRQLVEAHLKSRGYFVTSDSVDDALRRQHARIVRVRWEGGYPAQRASLDLPLARALMTALSEGTSTPPLAVPTLGGSLPTYLFGEVLKAPLIVFPIANYDNNQHAANENLRLGNLWEGIEAYGAMMAGIGRVWREGVVP
jgi:acetylornithine deacetylase/succinyl-diaminopimelate desuccinylase-like protein